jgi:hypothetical protein
MLTDAAVTAYRPDGFVVVPDVFSPGEIDRVTDEVVAGAARVTANDEIYDLEDSHLPRVRRLKAPHPNPGARRRPARRGSRAQLAPEPPPCYNFLASCSGLIAAACS